MTWTDVQLIPVLGAGWKIDSQAVITSGNQADYVAPMPSTCAAVSKLIKAGDAGGGHVNYLPPLGWTVLLVSDADDVQEDLWIEPGGKVWVISKCLAVQGGFDPSFTVAKTSGGSGWLWLFGIGALLWLTMKK